MYCKSYKVLIYFEEFLSFLKNSVFLVYFGKVRELPVKESRSRVS